MSLFFSTENILVHFATCIDLVLQSNGELNMDFKKQYHWTPDFLKKKKLNSWDKLRKKDLSDFANNCTLFLCCLEGEI